MRIFPVEKNAIIVSVGTHSIHIYEEEDGPQIYVNDHLNVKIEGKHKDIPKIIIDSGEFPTLLEVKDTEGSFTRMETKQK